MRLVALGALVALWTTTAGQPASATGSPGDASVSAQVARGTGELRTLGPGARGNLGVASFNAFVHLSRADARRDALALVSRRKLDIIGWQEANANPPADLGVSEQAGWTTEQPSKHNGNPHELAVSWRTSRFDLVSTETIKAHDKWDYDRGDDRSFPARYVLRVTLQRKGQNPDRVTVLDTHVNQHTERWKTRPGRPFHNVNAARARAHLRLVSRLLRTPDSRYTIVLGDLNWDFAADQRTLRPGFVQGRLGKDAVSNWTSLGTKGQSASHPASKRRVDYVLLSRRGQASFRSHKVLKGFRSDHRPVLARVALN